MESWQATYDVTGWISVVWAGETFPVALPESATIALQVNRDREGYGAEAIFWILGITSTGVPGPSSRTNGRMVLRHGPVSIVRTGLESLSRSCPGVGWTFHLDRLNPGYVQSLAFTVPWGRGNTTSGVRFSDPMPWPGQSVGDVINGMGTSGDDYEFTVKATTVGHRHWKWEAEPYGPPAPWLHRFWLDIEIETDAPPACVRVRCDTHAQTLPGLQTDVELHRV